MPTENKSKKSCLLINKVNRSQIGVTQTMYQTSKTYAKEIIIFKSNIVVGSAGSQILIIAESYVRTRQEYSERKTYNKNKKKSHTKLPVY